MLSLKQYLDVNIKFWIWIKENGDIPEEIKDEIIMFNRLFNNSELFNDWLIFINYDIIL